MEPCGSLWPNGEFSIGYSPCGGMERLETAEEYAAKWTPPLGLALDSNSHTFKDEGTSPRGTKGMTPHGKRVLRNAVAVMERKFGPKNMTFATLTLPKLTYEEFWNVSSNWSEIARVFYQKLSRALKRNGLSGAYAGCTELQPSRSGREEVPALHIHCVFMGRRRKGQPWALHPVRIRSIWSSVVQMYLWHEYDWSASENVQAIRKSAASYLAKYVSKSAAIDCEIRKDCTGWTLPTCWYNVSQALRRYVLGRVRVHPELMDAMEKMCTSGLMGRYCEYVFAGTIDSMRGPGPHYFVGKLTDDSYRELTKYWREVCLDQG